MSCIWAYVAKSGDRIGQSDVKLGVVLGERYLSVVLHQSRHGVEVSRLREAVLVAGIDDTNEFVGATFPDGQSVLPSLAGVTHKESAILSVSQLSHHILPK